MIKKFIILFLAVFLFGLPSVEAREPGTIAVGYKTPTEYISLEELSKRSDFSQLNPEFKKRLIRMFTENPDVGFGGGFRTEAQQEAEFLRRYEKSNDGSGVNWNGVKYKLKCDEKTKECPAPLAPPGKSMHEIGLAVDLLVRTEESWLQNNLVRFGLKTIPDLKEPWHIQPAELPNARYTYEICLRHGKCNISQDFSYETIKKYYDTGGVTTPAEPLKDIVLKPIADMVNEFYQWALDIGTGVALGIVIYGGVLYILSVGNPSKQTEAKEWIKSAIYGLLLLLLSYLLLYTINPSLVGGG